MAKNYPLVVYEDAQFRVVHIGEHPYRPLVFEESAGRDAMGQQSWRRLRDDPAIGELCRRLAAVLFKNEDVYVSTLD